MKTTSLKLFQPATLAALAIITLCGVSICPAQAGYTVTLEEVGTDVVATGSGAIDLTGLRFATGSGASPMIDPNAGHNPPGDQNPLIFTGPTSSSVDWYFLPMRPMSFGSGGLTFASSGSGDMVGIEVGGEFGFARVIVPAGYVSGNALSDMAIYSGQNLASLGVTPGTYVWTWGTGANQIFTLEILPCTGRCGPTPRPLPTPAPRLSP